MNSTCVRCGVKDAVTTVSYFNVDIICMDCDAKERQHPKFKEAQDKEIEAVRNGNLNFQGIGKPADL